jgi:hypothetical protein
LDDDAVLGMGDAGVHGRDEHEDEDHREARHAKASRTRKPEPTTVGGC